VSDKCLSDQVAIISGGLGDIGRATAMELARWGAHVAIGDVLPHEDASAALDQIEQLGVRSRYDRVDVSDAEEVSNWVSAVERRLGVASLIIPNAATVTAAGIRDISPQQWTRELHINLDGAFHLAQIGALRLLDRKSPGRIVFVGSWAAHTPHVHIPAYCVGKAGLRMLCKCMALDLAPHGILVNEVAPRYVDAGLSARLWKQQPALRQRSIDHVPTHQLITADEVARQIAHLCDPENRHMTGTVILMDGGLSLAGPRKRES